MLRGMWDRWGSWLRRHRREALDLVALGLAFLLLRRLGIGVPMAAVLCAFGVAVIVPLRTARPQPGLLSEFLAGAPRIAIAVGVSGVVLHFWLIQPLGVLWFGVAWPLVAFVLRLDWPRIATWISRRFPSLSHPVRGEFARCALLLVIALFLMMGFEGRTLQGTSDAYWYALNLADMTAQVRAGIFPVFAGQTIFQFNGALCPIRVAPAFHYLGAILDTLTFHQLGIFALQNLLITLLGVGALFSAYLGLRALLPGRAWLAAGLATLYLSCPGVLGIAYNSDLYMSWTTAPLVPLVWFATVRSFQDGGRTGTLVLLAAALGLCWWGHSPIALWSVLFAAAAQAARLCVQWRTVFWPGTLAAAAVFLAIAAYPVGSVLFFPPEPGAHVDLFQRALAKAVVAFIHQTFPATFLPLSATGRADGDFQMGYSLWLVLGMILWSQCRSWRPATAIPLGLAAFLALLILPIPGLDLVLWSAVPTFVRNTTGNWAVPRLCIQLAAATVFVAAACESTRAATLGRSLFGSVVLLGCVWNLSEACRFIAGSWHLARAPESAVDMLRPENIQLTRYSYSMFPHYPDLPTTFTHGVTDPEMENRLLAKDSLVPIATDLNAALARAHLEKASAFRWDTVPSHSASASLEQAPRIEPGHSYLLEFEFARPDDIHGVLQIAGDHFLREYGLPEHGGPKSFGAGGEHAKVLPLSTTAGPEDLTVTFFPAEAAPAGAPEPAVGQVRFLSYDRADLPVRVESWMPYSARVQSPAAAWLETPRAFQTGYEARVDGKPAAIRESPDALVAVAIPKGASSVELAYVAPGGLRFLFWLSFLASVGTIAFGAVRWILPLLGGQTPEKASGSVASPSTP
jgi:hypothetical protein